MDTIVKKIKELTVMHDNVPADVIKKKNVKLGLRNADGSGVVVGITTKGRVKGYDKIPGKNKDEFTVKPSEGKLIYCGYDVSEIVASFEQEQRFGFEEVAYLLLTGELPNETALKRLKDELSKRRSLSKAERTIIMEEVVHKNQMYALHSVISHMSRCDDKADSLKIEDVINQSINLIAKCPTVVANNYNFMRFTKGADLKIVRQNADMSTAEHFLYMLKGEKPDPYEAQIFDTAMVLHAEHGGGNNSTFTVRTVSSAGSNTYMSIAAGIASLSGHLHGGANESAKIMMKDLRKSVKDWGSEKQISNYLLNILDRKTGNGDGKIYGFGHAVYTVSDPRAVIFKKHAEELSKRKGNNAHEEFLLYSKVEEIAGKILSERTGKIIGANVDYYSGFVYKLLGIPIEIYTPIFAMARVVGWTAHRLEQIVQGKIMRPGYISVSDKISKYVPVQKRK